MHRQAELTAIRGLAALWVFVYHIPIYLGFASLDTPVVSAGYLGVPIFFILSISLLFHSLDDNPSLPHYFGRRLRRIWPMYFATVALVFFYYGHSTQWLLEQGTFAGVFIDNQTIGYIFWSLQIEEVAYLFFPAMHKLSDMNKSRLAAALYLAGVGAFFVILKSGLALSLWWLPLSLASYGLGIMVYQRKVPKLCLVVLPLAFFYWDTIQFEMASVFVAPGLAYLVQQATKLPVLNNKVLVWVGDNSYGLYLIHPLLLSVFGFFGVVLALPFAWVFESANKALISVVDKAKSVRQPSRQLETQSQGKD